MCGPYPRRRYYHIREFQMSASEIDSEETDSKDEIDLPSLEPAKDSKHFDILLAIRIIYLNFFIF